MEKMIAVSVDGTKRVIEFKVGQSYDLLKDAVNGWLECVSLPTLGVDMWCNEEGKLLGLESNGFATSVWIENYGFTDLIAGDVVFTGGVNKNGDTVGLKPFQFDAIWNRETNLMFM